MFIDYDVIVISSSLSTWLANDVDRLPGGTFKTKYRASKCGFSAREPMYGLHVSIYEPLSTYLLRACRVRDLVFKTQEIEGNLQLLDHEVVVSRLWIIRYYCVTFREPTSSYNPNHKQQLVVVLRL